MTRFAIPCEGGQIATHFGHTQQFAFFDVDPDEGRIVKEEMVDAPPHQPGLLPAWLAEHGTNVVLAAGMGSRAIGLFNQQGIKAVVGVTGNDLRKVVEDYIAGTLSTGTNVCDH